MPEFRAYQPADLPRVLVFLGKCFRDAQFKGFHPGEISHWMSSEYRGSDLETCFWLYERQGKLLAFAELAEADLGIYTLIVDPEFCDDATEVALIRECQKVMQERMRRNPAGKRVLTTHIPASDERRIEQLTELGYTVKPSAMVLTLRVLEFPVPNPVLPDGFEIRSVAGEYEALLVADVHDGAFGPKWSEAEYLKVMRTPSFHVERELVVVAPDGRFAAFLICWFDPISKSGLFEPVGCHKDFQRRGLASALMFEGMKRMMDAGMTTALVEHKRDNEAAAKLYASVGFELHFTTVDCELNFDEMLLG